MKERQEKKQDQYYEMANAPISKIIPKLAVPTIISMMVTSIYNMADTFFVSQLGTSASGAVGIIFSAMAIIQALAFMIGMGTGNFIARMIGAGNRKLAEELASIAFFTGFGVGLVIAVIGNANIGQLVRMLGSTETIAPYAEAYASYIFVAAPFMICSFIMNNLLRFQGKALFAMVGITTGGVLNMVLDPIFIFGFHLGVKGAALATVLSQAVGAIWILRFLSGKKTILHLRKENFKLQKEILLPCLALGISTFVMLSTESILSISFTSSLSRYGGDLAVGAMTIITSVSQLATLPLQGICQGGQPIMSYNFGAGNRDRVKKAFFTQFTACTVFTGCFWLIMLLFPKGFAGIFSNNTELITYTAWALRIYMAGIFSLGFQVACQQSFMALGQAKVSLLLACLRKLILLIPLIFILPHFIQNKVFAVFLAEPISDILAAAITTATFFHKILNRK